MNNRIMQFLSITGAVVLIVSGCYGTAYLLEMMGVLTLSQWLFTSGFFCVALSQLINEDTLNQRGEYNRRTLSADFKDGILMHISMGQIVSGLSGAILWLMSYYVNLMM